MPAIRIAAASSSKNADVIMDHIPMDEFAGAAPDPWTSLADAAGAAERTCPGATCCKPDPLIFLTAPVSWLEPRGCFVVEDAASGVQAAKAGGMAAIGVARLGDENVLRSASADLVVTAIGTRTLADGWELFGEAARRFVGLRGDSPGFWWGQLQFCTGPKVELAHP